MEIAALICAGLAALVHVYIFWIEAPGFLRVGRHVFGLSEAEAEIARPWAWNQGFYNAFLAIGVIAGLGLRNANPDAGMAIVVFALGSMLTASLVLVGSDSSQGRAALVQGLLPAAALALLVLSL